MDIENAKNMADEDGNMTRENFMVLGTKTKLVDLAGKEQTPEQTPTKHPHPHHNYYSKKVVSVTSVCILILIVWWVSRQSHNKEV